MELTDSLKTFLKETAQTLKGHDRRRFMAKTIEQLGSGGQCLAERELGRNSQTDPQFKSNRLYTRLSQS